MPSGITEGSTATVPHPAGSPVAVVPSVEYAVAVKVSVPISNELTDANALRFSLKQTAGVARSFPWKVLRYG